jgi:hypothetical protein
VQCQLNKTWRKNNMSNDLMIPEAGNVPAHILNPELASQANEDASGGISTGVPPRIKLAQKSFQLVDGNGEATTYPPAKMVAGPDGNTYLPVIVLRAKRSLTKTWYVSRYIPGEETSAPDCFSEDAIKPHSSITNPQGDNCETCALNAFGSGVDKDGNATAGKACADTKILAVFVPGFGVHALRIPAGSLKNFGLFVKQLSNAGIPLNRIKTFVGFDLKSEFTSLEFKFGGYLDAKFLPKVDELAQGSEVADIIGGNTSTVPAPQSNAAEEAAAKKKAAEEAAAKKKAAEEAAAKKKAAEEAAAEEAAAAANDDLGMDLGLTDAGSAGVDDFGLGLDMDAGAPAVEDDLGLGLDTGGGSDSADTDNISDNDLRAELGL